MSVQRNLYVNQWDCADMSVSLWLIRGVFESLTSQIYKWNVLNVSMTLTFTLTLNVTNKAYQLFRYQLETEFCIPCAAFGFTDFSQDGFFPYLSPYTWRSLNCHFNFALFVLLFPSDVFHTLDRHWIRSGLLERKKTFYTLISILVMFLLHPLLVCVLIGNQLYTDSLPELLADSSADVCSQSSVGVTRTQAYRQCKYFLTRTIRIPSTTEASEVNNLG